MKIAEKLAELGLKLPQMPAPAGAYVPYRRHGAIVYVAGQLPLVDGQVAVRGPCGSERSVAEGQEAARLCALNALAVLDRAAGGLEKVAGVLLVTGYVYAEAGFGESPQVLNGASELFAQVLGEAGLHARAAVAVAGLPKDATVEIQVTAALK